MLHIRYYLGLSVGVGVSFEKEGGHHMLIGSTGVDDWCGTIVVLKVNICSTVYQDHSTLHIASQSGVVQWCAASLTEDVGITKIPYDSFIRWPVPHSL